MCGQFEAARLFQEFVSVGEGRGCRFLWGCFLAPNLMGPSLDPNSLPATKWPWEGQEKVLGEKEPGSRQEKARLPK